MWLSLSYLFLGFRAGDEDEKTKKQENVGQMVWGSLVVQEFKINFISHFALAS